MKIKFYLTSAGNSPVEDFIAKLPDQTKSEVIDALSLLNSGKTLQMPLSRNLSAIKPGLHELRFRDRQGQLRIMYYLRRSDSIYLIHAFRKKTQEIADRDVKLTLKRLREL